MEPKSNWAHRNTDHVPFAAEIDHFQFGTALFAVVAKTDWGCHIARAAVAGYPSVLAASNTVSAALAVSPGTLRALGYAPNLQL